jgi:two-component system sensor histidine kinase KdpD
MSEPEAVMRLVAEGAVELLGSERSVLLLKGDDQTLRTHASHDRHGRSIREVNGPMSERVLEALADALGGMPLAVPLVARNEIMGVLAVDRASVVDASDESAWLLSALADHASVALCHTTTVAELARLADRGDTDLKDDERGRMFSALAHDLKSPLWSIRIGCELLARVAEGKQAEIIEQMLIAHRHLEQMTNNLSRMDQLEAGVMVLEPESTPLSKIIHEAVAIAEPRATEHEQNIETVIEHELEGWVDPARLREVLVNLLDNAVKYGPDGSAITVTLRGADEGRAAIDVSDRGPGIPSNLRESIFESYVRLRSSAAGKTGSGLGLSIARGLARKMGGEITLASEEGEGTTFTILVPTSPPE